jgi:hypothetical protein
MVETKPQSIEWLEFFGRFWAIFKKIGQQFFGHLVWRLKAIKNWRPNSLNIAQKIQVVTEFFWAMTKSFDHQFNGHYQLDN